MSKVPAHYELIPEIKRLRDEIAPQTLLTINGDIRDRQHGEELVKKYGIDGVMIGRGIFQNPFAFAPLPPTSEAIGDSLASGRARESSERSSLRTEDCLSKASSAGAKEVSERDSLREEAAKEDSNASRLLSLLHLHLDLFDKYSLELEPRKYEPLKRFFKIYVRDFPGASDLRDQLMHTKSTDEVRAVLADFNS